MWCLGFIFSLKCRTLLPLGSGLALCPSLEISITHDSTHFFSALLSVIQKIFIRHLPCTIFLKLEQDQPGLYSWETSSSELLLVQSRQLSLLPVSIWGPHHPWHSTSKVKVTLPPSPPPQTDFSSTLHFLESLSLLLLSARGWSYKERTVSDAQNNQSGRCATREVCPR